MIDNLTLGILIKQTRIIEGYTQEELARITGVSRSHLSRIERGLIFPNTRILSSLAKPLDLDEHDLLICAAYTAMSHPECVSDSILSEIVANLKAMKHGFKDEYANVVNIAGG